MLIGAKLNQFWQQTSACTVDGDKELRNGSNIQPPILNAASKTTVDTGMANTCYATLERILYFVVLHLHQPKISNLKSFGSSQSSPKYLSTSFCFLDTTLCYSRIKATIHLRGGGIRCKYNNYSNSKINYFKVKR